MRATIERSAFLRWRWDLVLFCLGLLGILFAYGVAVGKYRLFPHGVISRAGEAVQDLRDNWRHYLGIRSRYLQPTTRTAGGVTVYDRAAAAPGAVFMTISRDGRFGASLMGREGQTLHTWDVAFSAIFPEPDHLEVVPPDFDVSIHGAALLPNGDVILSFGLLGAARVDRCSRVLWTVPAETHHAVEPLPNGETLLLSRRKHTAADARFPRLGPGPEGFFWEETILRVRPDGSVAEEISVLDVLYDSGWEALLFTGAGSEVRGSVADPVHHNDAEVLRADMADAFPLFEAGDVILSLRNISSLLVVDGRTWRIKWAMTGPFLMQHDPDFLPNGNILVFDNRITGETPQLGYSRLLEIDPVTREVVWSYEGTDEEPFYTHSGGMQQLLPNGNVLAVESRGGRVFEVARGPTNRIVWEYVNLQQEGFVGQLSDAQHVGPGELTFLGESCGGAAPGEAAEARAGVAG